MDAIGRVLEKLGADAFVMIGSSSNPDMRYITRFITTDAVLFIRKKGDKGTIIVSQMEYDRALRESAVGVMTRSQAGLLRILETERDRYKAFARMIRELTPGPVMVPPDFPFALGSHLSDLTTVIIDSGTVPSMRERKKSPEVNEIRMVQSATEAAMNTAVNLIRKSKRRKGGLYSGETPLTSEMIRSAMHRVLLDQGCIARETIVSCGKDTAFPHITGTGQLRPDEPIVIDIFPRREASGYYTDMTRTVVKGVPSAEVRDMYEAVRDGQDLAADRLKAGVLGSEVYQAVVDFFHDRGYGTGVEGFVHNLGHGVGLEVHELPTIGPGGGKLHTGSVVTNEPGLYYREIGGVRLENIGVISRSGIDCMTQFQRELVL